MAGKAQKVISTARNFIVMNGHEGKVWSINVFSTNLSTSYGKTSGDLKNTTRHYADPAKCQREADKLIASKRKEGYREVTLNIPDVPVQVLWKVEEAKKKQFKELSVWTFNSEALVREICTISSLESLTLKNVSVLPPEIANLTRLRRFEIEDSHRLERIPPEIGALTKLTALSIKDTGATSLPDELGNLTRLESLFIWGNEQLVAVPKTIGKLVKLKQLWIQHNRELNQAKAALQIPALGTLVNLVDLSLSSNHLKTLPAGLGKLKKLEDLDLSFNKLEALPLEICGLTKLDNLELDYNKLKSLPRELVNLKKLDRLALEGCPIKNLPEEVVMDENIQEIFAHLRGETPERPSDED